MGKFAWVRVTGEKAMTLVEVLAAIVILSIVFIGFMMIFPQMTNFNEKTGTKLSTMNIARQEIVAIQGKNFATPFVETDILAQFPTPPSPHPAPTATATSNGTKITYWNNGYDLEAEIFTNTVDLSNGGIPGNNSLYKVQLKVMIDGKASSVTYGYIEIAG